MKRVLRILLSGSVVLLVVLTANPAQALEDLVPYDDFSAPLINPDKWIGNEFGFSGREAVREIQLNQLRLGYRSYGDTAFDTGLRGGSLLLGFPNPDAVTAIKATVGVGEVQIIGCTTPGSSGTDARAQLTGRFFNTGTPTPGSSLGDVFAFIRIIRATYYPDPPGVLRVESNVGECADAACSTANGLAFDDLGPIDVGQTTELRIQWDRDNHQFIFQRDAGPEIFSPYVVSDTAPPSQRFKILEVFQTVANCTATPRPMAFMEAFFSNVFVNASAASPTRGR